MTPEEFWKFVEKYTIFYGKRKYTGEISATNKDLLYKIESMNFDDSCMALHQVAKEYSQIDQYPKELTQVIYFVIMREITKRVFNEEGKKKYLGKDGKIHRSFNRMGISKEVFMALKTGVMPSMQKEYEEEQKKIKAKKPNYMKQQERMGIEPYHDFFWAYFGDVGFKSRNNRGVFDSIVRVILKQQMYPVIIDLSGECTILENLAFAKDEIIFCRDVNACILYNTLKTNYTKFHKALKERIKAWSNVGNKENSVKEDIENFKKALNEEINREKEKLPREQKKLYNNAMDEYGQVLCTYPYEQEESNDKAMTELAVKYFLVGLYEGNNLVLEDSNAVLNIAEYLKERIKNVNIVFGSGKELVTWLSADIPKDLALLPIKKDKNHKVIEIASTYFELKSKTKARNKEKIVSGYTDGRLEKGVVFIDLTVNGESIEDISTILNLLKVTECKWIIICEKDDSIIRKNLKHLEAYEVYLKDNGLPDYEPRLKSLYNRTVLTNIPVDTDEFCLKEVLTASEIQRCQRGSDIHEENWDNISDIEKVELYQKTIYAGRLKNE